MDDRIQNGIKSRILNVIDKYTQEFLAVIDSFDLLPIKWKYRNTITQGDKLLVGASDEDPYIGNENSPALVQGNLANSEDSSFSFQLDVFHLENSIIELKTGC